MPRIVGYVNSMTGNVLFMNFPKNNVYFESRLLTAILISCLCTSDRMHQDAVILNI